MKSLRQMLLVAGNEARLILKDRGSLAILFVLPLVLTAVFGNLNRQFASPEASQELSFDVCLVNEDGGRYGRQMAEALSAIGVLQVQTLDSAQAAEARVSAGEVEAAILLPADLTAQIEAYQPVAITVVIDPTQAATAEIVTGIVRQVADELAIAGEAQHGVHGALETSGAVDPAAEAQGLGAFLAALGALRGEPAITVNSETSQGIAVHTGIEAIMALIYPGITVMFVFFIVGMAGHSLLRERDDGTLGRLLAAPIAPVSVIGGKALAYALLACTQVAVLFTVGHLAYAMPLGRAPLALILLTVLLGLVASAFGLLVGAIARTPRRADNIGTLLAFLLAALGGCMGTGSSPLVRSAGLMGSIARLTPQGNALGAYYTLLAENGSLGNITAELGRLGVMLALFVIVAAWRYRIER